MTGTRKICAVTGTRADYGLLYWPMKEIAAAAGLELQLIVTGTHLEAPYGHTADVIEADGFRIDARVPLGLKDDTAETVTDATGAAVAGIGRALAALKPDAVLLLGDRYEILAAATAAALHRVPVAHLHGGEVTEGAIDDAMRHAITKLAALHFAAAEPYRQRIIQMGEDPARVFTVGAPGLDHLERTELLDADATRDALNLDAETPYLLITVHPATLGADNPAAEIDALLTALDGVSGHAVVFTGVNADTGRDAIAARIDAYASAHPENARMFTSLGQQRYLSAMQHAAAVVGNSSSGIIEAPALDVPTVNIGPRQDGRLRAGSIADCAADAASVAAALGKVLDPAFRRGLKDAAKPYGRPGASAEIARVLAETDPALLQRKPFHDIPGLRAAS